MAMELVGNSGNVADVSLDHLALKTQSAPIDAQGLGSYSLGAQTGILPAALAATAEIFQFRWADATRLAVIRRIRISACVSTTFFAAGVPVQIDLIKSTGWTVAGTGGTAPTIATSLKKRSSMQSSLIVTGDLRISTTAALGAGTKSFDANPLAFINAPGPITLSLNGEIIKAGTVLFEANLADGDYPLILAQNEGLSIRSVAVPATGTWQATVHIDWAEVVSY